MVVTIEEDAPSSMVKKCAAEFKQGWDNLEDDPHPGGPAEVTTQENINCVHDEVTADHRVDIRTIAEVTGISKSTVQRILTRYLDMHKVSARWVPRLLTPDQNRMCYTTSRDNLQLFRTDPADFCAWFVTVDET